MDTTLTARSELREVGGLSSSTTCIQDVEPADKDNE
jgi:hypothetical protein